jgi:hypothetical protein
MSYPFAFFPASIPAQYLKRVLGFGFHVLGVIEGYSTENLNPGPKSLLTMLTESFLLAGLGGLIGMVFAWWGMPIESQRQSL